MGYGGGDPKRIQGVPRGPDGGIDGKIDEDKLGLDQIYIQAKRYSENSVGRPTVQSFLGAMTGGGCRKGVFVTSSTFTSEAKKFADAIHEKFPGKLLAYNCSPSFNWKKHLSDSEIASFQKEISAMGYKFQFITLAGFHTQNIAIFELAEKYKKEGMSAYSKIQEQEFAREKDGYTSVKHQREVGTSYFDAVSNTISSGKSSTTAMDGSTESEQF